MSATAAIIATVILAALAVFQAALALGKPLGHFAWGGQHRVLPMRLRMGSVISIPIYAFMALVLLDRADVISVFPDGFVNVAAWVIAAYFVVGIFMNAISRSKPERFTMTPLTIVLAAAAAIVAAG